MPEQFIEAKDRIASSVADAEFNFKEMLREDANKTAEAVGYFDFGKHGGNTQSYDHRNPFATTMDYMGLHLG
jgi:hypothetical protein